MQQSLFDIKPEKVEPRATAFGGRITLRPYQEQARRETHRLFAEGAGGVLIRQPTGTGKTVVGTCIADDWLQGGPKRRVMVLADQRQFVWQFREELMSMLQRPVGIEMGEHSQPVFGQDRIIVASRQTLMEQSRDGQQLSRLYKYDPTQEWLLLIDEAHRWKYSLTTAKHIIDWFEQNPNSRRLGLTATPRRGDGVSLSRLFPSVALDYALFAADGQPSAIRDGWVVSYDCKFVSLKSVDFKELDSAGKKDFDETELDDKLSEKTTLDELMQPLIKLAGDRRTIVFLPGVKTAKDLANQINAERDWLESKGMPVAFGEARSLDGSVPERVRKEVFYAHQSGDFQFLCVCNLCREGYNDPGIACVAIFRPTKSPSLVEQMVGRGCRPLKGPNGRTIVDGLDSAEERRAAITASAKPNCRIIDLVGASGRIETVTAAHILAEGLDDEVVERTAKAVANGESDVDEAIAKARREVDAEEREAQRIARMEREAAEKKKADELARFRTEVDYSVSDVAPGAGETTERRVRNSQDGPTEGQFNYLVHVAGYDAEAVANMSKKQAGAVIGRCKKKGARGQSRRPPTPDQLRVLAKHGRATPATYDDAANMIQDINRELTGAR